MYNDENNYHYTYEKGGDQPGQRYDARSGGEPAPHCQS